MTRKAAAAGGIGVLAAVLGLASFAWACTNFARVDAISPPADVARSEVTVRGAGVIPHSEVVLLWNAVNGPEMGKAPADASGNFTVRGIVPDVAPGVYSVIAASGEVGQGRAAFEVVAPAGVSPAPALPGGNGLNGPDSRLWTGFDAGSGRLDSPADAPDVATQIGIGVLALGLVGMGAGVVVVSLRRRRVLVSNDR